MAVGAKSGLTGNNPIADLDLAQRSVGFLEFRFDDLDQKIGEYLGNRTYNDKKSIPLLHSLNESD